jgi:hypothetical protein
LLLVFSFCFVWGFSLYVLFSAVVVVVVLFRRRRLLLGCEHMVVSMGVAERMAILGSGGSDFWCGC